MRVKEASHWAGWVWLVAFGRKLHAPIAKFIVMLYG
jgi:hypothetical protein